jgi:hypothetical protein
MSTRCPIGHEHAVSIRRTDGVVVAHLAVGIERPIRDGWANPWYISMDGSLARRLGFQPAVRTVYQAAKEDHM